MTFFTCCQHNLHFYIYETAVIRLDCEHLQSLAASVLRLKWNYHQICSFTANSGRCILLLLEKKETAHYQINLTQSKLEGQINAI